MNNGNFVDSHMVTAHAQVRYWAITTLYLIVGLLFILTTITAYYFCQTISTPGAETSTISAIHSNTTQRQELEAQHAWMQEWRKRCTLLTCMDVVTPLLPNELSFSKVNYNSSEDISIEGEAESIASVLQFIENLQTNASCKRAHLVSMRQSEHQNHPVTFQLKVTVNE